MLRPVLFALCVAALTAPARADDAADLKALVGKWKIEKAVLDGTDIFDHVKTIDFEIKADGKYAVKFGEERDNGSFTVDSAKTPKAMVIKPTGGPDKDKTLKAIYKLDGDDLTICYQMGGGDTPKTFESKPDTKLFLVTYKREKK